MVILAPALLYLPVFAPPVGGREPPRSHARRSDEAFGEVRAQRTAVDKGAKRMRSMERRPVGVTILAVLAIIAGVLSLIGGILLITGGAAIGAGAVAASSVSGGLVAFAVIEGIVSVILGALMLAFGVGALRADPWAWSLGMIVSILNIISGVASILIQAPRVGFGYALEQNIIGLVIAIIILAYLNSAHVRAYFGRRTSAGML